MPSRRNGQTEVVYSNTRPKTLGIRGHMLVGDRVRREQNVIDWVMELSLYRDSECT